MPIRHAPRHPSLPQQDGAAGREGRQRQLASARAKYAWAHVEALPGVPVVADVPFHDEPTLSWLLGIADVALDVAINAVMARASGGTPRVARSGRIEVLRSLDEVVASGEHDALGEIAEIERALRVLGDAKSAAPAGGNEAHALLSLDPAEQVKAHLQRLWELAATGSVPSTDPRVDVYKALFRTLPLPEIAQHVHDDDRFAQLRVAGANPMVLEVMTAVPTDLGLSEADWAAVMGPDDALEDALAERRVFVADYQELRALHPGTTAGLTKFTYSPIAVFGRARGAARLVPVGIQAGPDATATPLQRWVPEGDPARWRWELAKFAVQVADMNYHELFSHLARTHLVLEAFAIATHRHLADQHPLFALLVPHLEGTLFINDRAAKSLINDANSPIGQVFAGTIQSTQAATSQDRLKVQVQASYLPAELARRGVADPAVLPHYPYRDDGLRLWDAIGTWVRDYVGLYYVNDTDVMADTELAGWHAALVTHGQLDDLPTLRKVEDVVGLFTYVLFTASAQHAAVNFPQRTLMSFAPAMTGAGWSPWPTTARVGEADWLRMLPSADLALVQVTVTTLLGTMVHRPLGQYAGYGPLSGDWFRDPRVTSSDGPLARFREALAAVAAEIDADNARPDAWARPYPYLRPDRVPASINI